MKKPIPVFYEGAVCGTLEAEPVGMFLRFRGRCSLESAGLLRAYLLLEEGVLPLGVALPENGQLLIRQTVSQTRLTSRPLGKAVLCAGFPELPFSPWQGELCGRMAKGLSRPLPNGRELALPMELEKPFPFLFLIGLFSFRRIGGAPHLLLRLDDAGTPLPPDKAPSGTQIPPAE